MSTITYDSAVTTPVAATSELAPTAGKSFWARMLDRLVEARMRQAMAEVRRYGIVLPRELEDANLSAKASKTSALPFQR